MSYSYLRNILSLTSFSLCSLLRQGKHNFRNALFWKSLRMHLIFAMVLLTFARWMIFPHESVTQWAAVSTCRGPTTEPPQLQRAHEQDWYKMERLLRSVTRFLTFLQFKPIWACYSYGFNFAELFAYVKKKIPRCHWHRWVRLRRVILHCRVTNYLRNCSRVCPLL